MIFFLLQASKIKGCEALGQWIEPIRNHYWHCLQTCNRNVTKLKVGMSQKIGSNTCTYFQFVINVQQFTKNGYSWEIWSHSEQ